MKKLKWFYALCITIPVSCSSPKAEISEIEFTAESCFGTCPAFTMKILGDGTAFYHAQVFNDQVGNFTTTIRKVQLDSLKTLIADADIFSLRKKYFIEETCNPTYTLTIKQQNGYSKTISDYGPDGPKRLRKVYDFIFLLRNSQDWK